MESRLSYCRSANYGVVKYIDGGAGAVENAGLFGIAEGNSIEVDEYSGEGPVSLKTGNRQISVGKELASKVVIDADKGTELPLSQIKAGDVVEIVKNNSNGDIRHRLLDMGIVKGVNIEVIRYAPLGDPVEVKAKGFCLTLRIQEAETIIVKPSKLGENTNGNKKKWFSFNGA